jgi:hypothetical protein
MTTSGAIQKGVPCMRPQVLGAGVAARLVRESALTTTDIICSSVTLHKRQ